MFKAISFDDDVLSSPDFRKDELSFSLLPTLIKKRDRYPGIRCFSDSKNCVILNTDADHPVVIWTSQEFDNYEGLYSFLTETFSDNTPLMVTTKSEVYQFFKNNNRLADSQDTKILGAYKCEKLNDIVKIGHIDAAKPEERETVAKMIEGFQKEALPEEKHSFSYYLEQADKYITLTDINKVWRDENGEIASIGHINISNTVARVGEVYTIPSKRGRSYAKMLVNELVKIILKMKLLPVLYTNFQYEPSNKCYKAVGFELIDTIFSYNIKK